MDGLGRALILLQRYPVALLLPAFVIVFLGLGIDHALAALALSKFQHFLVVVIELLIDCLLGCVAFLCVANYTVRSEANSEPPALRNIFDSLAYPGYRKLLTALLARFALAAAISTVATALLLTPAFSLFRRLAHHRVPRSISAESYLWISTIFAVLILARWSFAIPLFTQSKGTLKSAWETSAKVIQGRTLFSRALSYPLTRLASPLHPHLSDGAARYAPQLIEIAAAYAFSAVLWTYWMIAITLLAMQLQGGDAPEAVALTDLPLESA
jgi:hypothetical protein